MSAEPAPELTVAELARLTAEVSVSERPPDTPVTASFNRAMIDALRAGHGQIPGELGDILLLVLTTTGRRSGVPRSCPVGYFVVGGRLLVLASMGGSDRHPDWYHNVIADSKVTVELNGARFTALASPTRDGDRDVLFAEICRRSAVFAEYQQKTARTIPVVEITSADRDIATILARNPAALSGESGG